MSDFRHGVPTLYLSEVIAKIAPDANQIHAARDPDGNWNLVWHGDTPGSTVNGYRPDPPRTPPTAA